MERRPPKTTRKAKSKKKTNKLTPGKIFKYSFLVLLLSFIVAVGYQYRHGLLYWLGFKTNSRMEALSKEESRLESLRIYEILARHKGKVYGIDVSHYQGNIDWPVVKAENSAVPLGFVFIRATMGEDRDGEFRTNWDAAKSQGFLRGAYHYYRPDENSLDQADNFIKHVKLSKGDLPPVLDIEKIPNKQSMDSLHSGLKRWLDKVEKHYGMKPIIYSGESFYTDFLKEEFEGYKLWIANYNFFEDKIRKDWLIWQFTDKATLNGIEGPVDLNIYNGSLDELKRMIKK